MDKNQLRGKMSELVALSSFACAGFEIAVPYGNQAGWDFLFREGTMWMRAQVKTAFLYKGRLSIRNVKTTGRVRRSYSKYTLQDADYLVAAIPETATVWKIPISDSHGQTIYLTDEWLLDKTRIASVASCHPIATVPRKTPLRSKLLAIKPFSRPPAVAADSWEMLIRFTNGFSYSQIADASGIRADSAKDRITRAANQVFKFNLREQ